MKSYGRGIHYIMRRNMTLEESIRLNEQFTRQHQRLENSLSLHHRLYIELLNDYKDLSSKYSDLVEKYKILEEDMDKHDQPDYKRLKKENRRLRKELKKVNRGTLFAPYDDDRVFGSTSWSDEE